MIILKNIKFKNFLSTGNHFVEIQLDKDPMTLVRGRNGEGKSIILDAICYSLYGKSYRKINKGAMVNSINQREALVIIEFTVNNKNYRVERGMAPAVFEIYENDKILNPNASAKDYQKILEDQILKINFKSFTQIVILGSASFVPFMKLSSPERRLVIEDILDIQIFSFMKNIVKSQQIVIKNEFEDIKHRLSILETSRKMLQNHYNKLKSYTDENKSQTEFEIGENAKKVDDLAMQIEECTENVSELKGTIKHESKVLKESTELIRLETGITRKLSGFMKNKDFYETEDECPTCHQEILEEFKTKTLAYYGDEIEKLNKGLVDIETVIKDNRFKIREIEEVKARIMKLNMEINSAAGSVKYHVDHNKKLQLKMEDLTKEKESTNDDEETINKNKEAISLANKEKLVVNEERHYNNILNAMLNDGGIKTMIIKQYLPLINHRVNYYLKEMDFFINFELDEEFNETIKSRHRDEFSYHSFSEGEKKRIDIALLLTWRHIATIKNSSPINLLIMDEIFDSSLDQLGIEDMFKLFAELEKTNLFIVSHRGDILEDKFYAKLEVEKINNFTRITAEA